MPQDASDRYGVVAIVVASIGRPNVIKALLSSFAEQSRLPDYVILSCSTENDVPTPPEKFSDGWSYKLAVCYGPAGLARQRNNGLRWLRENSDVLFRDDGFVAFVDDDFLMRSDWLQVAVRAFQGNPGTIGLTGVLLADGTENTGYTEQDARAIVATGNVLLHGSDWRQQPGPVKSLYGCNMIVRSGGLRLISFDEALPLYGWLEDYDFSRRLAALGVLERLDSLIGVHLAHKHGRTSGVRFGYSQVANPMYLLRKGTLVFRFAMKLMLQCIITNAMRSLWPEPYIDRRGRFKGNLKGLRDLLFMRLDPSHIEDML